MQGGVDQAADSDDEHHPFPGMVDRAVRHDVEHQVDVDPDDEEDEGADQELVKRDALAHPVSLLRVAIRHRLRDQRHVDGA